MMTPYERWTAIYSDAPSSAREWEWERLRDAYADPLRSYHSFRHLAEVLESLERFENVSRSTWIAAMFHDVVYNPRSSTNEEDSARWLREAHLRMGLQPDEAAEAAILATKAHFPANAEQARLLDADLSIFASSPERYREYAAAIRDEFKHVATTAFRNGRSAVLRSFLRRDRIYHTAEYDALEEDARRNISAELESLKASNGLKANKPRTTTGKNPDAAGENLD